MIVKMKKITLVVQAKDVEPTLISLGKLGLLHIEHQNVTEGEEITEAERKYHSLSKAIEILPDTGGDKNSHKDPEDFAREALDLVYEKEIILESLRKINKDIETWKAWGDFDPELVDSLKDKGISVQLCRLTKKQIKEAPDGIIVEKLFKKGNVHYCAIISQKDMDLEFDILNLPVKSLGEMIAEEKKQRDRLAGIDKRLVEIAGYKNMLVSRKRHLEFVLEFNGAREGMGRFESLSYIKGYCPIHAVNSLERRAKAEKWGLLVEDPDENDNVPTLIKNPRWIEMIKPVFQVIKTIPGYREVDISFWFLLFFSVFFGMLIGDAGYGVVFFIVNLFCHAKFKKRVRDKSIFILTYILSISTIIWGILTGTFFGQLWLSTTVKPLLPFLRESRNIQALCFFIGAFHLSIAHTWKFIRKMPSLKAFSEAGWVCMLWAAYFLARMLILSEAFPELGKYLFICGAALVILCTNPTKNIFKTVGSGIGGLLLNVINAFTDTVSYIRLFAVGAATVAVADAFNQMALSIGYGNIISGFFTALVLIFGHTLNILLGAMAVLVHGVRLNVLEFSSHLNMEWSGIEYKPFKQEVN